MRISNSEISFKLKMKYVLIAVGALFLNSFFSAHALAQAECSGTQLLAERKCAGDEVSKPEQELFRMINDYRSQNNLPPVPMSAALSLVANRHLIDLEKNIKSITHSWSNCPYDIKEQNTWNCVFNAPQRLNTDYAGRGYENLYRSATQTATAPLALDAWKKSPLHNSLILNLSFFKDDVYDACGIAIRGNYAALWMGSSKGAQNNQFKPKKDTNLDLSFERVTENLTDVLSINKVSTTFESNKWVGTSKDKSITLEIYGRRENISEATLNFRAKLEKNKLSEKNKFVMLVFLKNVMPDWSKREEWFESALLGLYKNPRAAQIFTENKKVVELSVNAKNFISLMVEPEAKRKN